MHLRYLNGEHLLIETLEFTTKGICVNEHALTEVSPDTLWDSIGRPDRIVPIEGPWFGYNEGAVGFSFSLSRWSMLISLFKPDDSGLIGREYYTNVPVLSLEGIGEIDLYARRDKIREDFAEYASDPKPYSYEDDQGKTWYRQDDWFYFPQLRFADSLLLGTAPDFQDPPRTQWYGLLHVSSD